MSDTSIHPSTHLTTAGRLNAFRRPAFDTLNMRIFYGTHTNA